MVRRQRVRFFIESLAGGGAEKVLVSLANHLDPQRFAVTLVTVTDGGVWQSAVQAHVHLRSLLHTARAHTLRYKICYRLLRKLPAGLAYRLFLRGRFDADAAFCEGLATKLIAAGRGKRKLCWVHIDPIADPHGDAVFASLAAEQHAYGKFDEILCVSQGTKEQFSQKFGAFPRLRVQYNPLDVQTIRAKAALPAQLPPREGLLLVAIARLVPQKGVEQLLHACARLHAEGFRFTLWLLGEGPLRPVLERQLPPNAHLLGFRQNPYACLAQADAYVSASQAEGFSTAAAEALVLGKPVLALHSAGMAEVLGGAPCGLLGDDIEHLLRRVLQAPDTLAPMQRAAAARGAQFSLEQRIREIEGVLST